MAAIQGCLCVSNGEAEEEEKRVREGEGVRKGMDEMASCLKCSRVAEQKIVLVQETL
mgnify:CR=1 FL=1